VRTVTTLPPTFGELLRRYRAAIGLTQEELAERARLSANGISHLERGIRRSPHLDTVRLLAEALDLAPQDRAAFETAARRQSQASPALAPSRTAAVSTLPVPLTPLIGREREEAAVSHLLRRSDVRLLTLTGPAGVGKTRLALQVVAGLLDEFPEGVFVISLAPIGDAAFVPSTIAQALAAGETVDLPLQVHLQGGVVQGDGPAAGAAADRPSLESLGARLGGRRVLLLLDNFEHVLSAAFLVADLLAAYADLKVLITSRGALRVRGEHEFPVPPLELPAPQSAAAHGLDLALLSRCPAVSLFVQRATAVKPGFQLTHANGSAVADICRRLDGLPLAIELAAARMKLFQPQALLARLAHRLQLLTDGTRDLPARQQTLRAAIDWSYDLLDTGEQLLFARLSVFVGGCTLEALEEVCAAAGSLPYPVLDGLTSLLDKSLLQVDEQEDPAALSCEPRFGMLETIREYAAERLAASGEEDALRRAHAACYLSLAEHAEHELTGPDQAAWLARLEDEHDNLRAALRWAQEEVLRDTLAAAAERAALGLRLAGALWRFWLVHGHLSEGRGWLARFLALTADGEARGASSADPALAAARAKALDGAAGLAYSQGDYTRAWVLYEDALAVQRLRGDGPAIARTLGNLGNVAIDQGDYARATGLNEESLALCRALGDKQGITFALTALGAVAHYQGDYARATALYDQSLALRRELGNPWGIAVSLTNLAEVARAVGEGARAEALYAESLGLLGAVRDTSGVPVCLEGLAAIAAAGGQAERAALLFGAAAALRLAIGAPLPPSERAGHERAVAAARAALGPAAFAAAWARGQAMTVEEARAAAVVGRS
jgi:predicted ATPase/DNA-binding XRE family transcriptional regulator